MGYPISSLSDVSTKDLLAELRQRELPPGTTVRTETHTTVNALSALCHQANRTWWLDPSTGAPLTRNKGELLMLIVSEVAEAMEGARKGVQDDKLPHRRMEEVELADTLIRIFDYAGGFQLDLGGALVEKLEYNSRRADHKPAHRLADGGKKW